MAPLPPVDLGALATHWQARPGVLTLVALAAAGYLAGAGRLGRRWPAWRTACFLAGLAVVVVATGSGLEAYGRTLEWAHMIEHLLLIMVAPTLVALGSPLQLVHDALPPAGARRWRAVLARPAVGWLTAPATGAILYAVAVVGVHLTDLMHSAMQDPATHLGEELAYLVAGYLLFQSVFGVSPGPHQLTNQGRLILLALTTPVDAVVGFVLLQTGQVDQDPGTVTAGTTMWVGGTGIMAAYMVVVALLWLHGRAPERTTPSWTDRARQATFAQHTGGAADRDVDADDAALADYNAYLARLAARERARDA